MQNQNQPSYHGKGTIIDVSTFRYEVVDDLAEYCYVREISSKMVEEYPFETIVLAGRFSMHLLEKAMITLLPLIVSRSNVLELIKSSE